MKTEHEIASTQVSEAATSPAPSSGTTSTPKAANAKAIRTTKPIKGVKLHKQSKAAKAVKNTAEGDNEPADRLPTTLAELKETKSGLVAYLHLVGKDKDAIAKELKAAFKLSETQAVKITRRITGRVRLYKRVLELVPAKA
jgi:hypothetical protein